jgi:hypothetical protein
MSFINSYDEIKAQIEERIDNIDGLSDTDAALVAAAAQLLNGRNQPISNMPILLEYLQGKQDLVVDTTTIKEIVLLLGASMGSKNVVWRMREFLADGTFTVPNNIAGGVVYVTGSGGGGSGAAWITSINNTGVSGACSGCYIDKMPVNVLAGSVIPVVIGAGGASVVVSAVSPSPVGNDGQHSAFGSLIIPGGSGGGEYDAATNQPRAGGWVGGYVSAAVVFQPENSVRYKASSRARQLGAVAMGSAAGAFGDAGVPVASSGASVTAGSAAANSGAGGGSAIFFSASAPSVTVTSGAGGSGRIIVEWQEFV